MPKEKDKKKIEEMSRKDLEAYACALEKEAKTLAELARRQEKWIGNARRQHAKLQRFAEKKKKELARYQRDVPRMEEEIRRDGRQLRYLTDILQQFQVHGGNAILTNFGSQIGFGKNIAKIIIEAKGQEALLTAQDEGESSSTQEFSSEEVEFSIDEPADG